METKKSCNRFCEFIFGCENTEYMLKHKIQTILYVLSMLVLLSAMGLLITGFYLFYFDGNPPIRIANQPIQVTPSVVSPGDTIYLHFEVCKYISAPAQVESSFLNLDTNDVSGFKSTTSRIINNGNCGEFEYAVEIPNTVTAGTTIVNGTNSYVVNILKTRHVEWQTEAFTVLPPK